MRVWDERFIRTAQRTEKGRLVYLEGRVGWRKRKAASGELFNDAQVTIPRGVGLVKFMDPPASAFTAPQVEEGDEGEDGSATALGSES